MVGMSQRFGFSTANTTTNATHRENFNSYKSCSTHHWRLHWLSNIYCNQSSSYDFMQL